VPGGPAAGAVTRRSIAAAERLGRFHIAHPNVVVVHDVGTHDRHLFVAMGFAHCKAQCCAPREASSGVEHVADARC
jgi:hypothetical protein